MTGPTTFNVGDLAPGETNSFTVSCVVNGDGGDVIANNIQITTSTEDINPNNNTDEDDIHIVTDMCLYPASIKAGISVYKDGTAEFD